MAEIILIQPFTGQWDEMSTRFPESLLAVASVPASKGYDVRILDQRVNKDFDKALANAVGPETKIIGVTAITGEQVKFALKVTEDLKQKFPHIPVCWGGVHATLVPEQTAAHPLIDYVIVGDGDLVFCELFERLRDNLPVSDLRSLVYKTDTGEVKSNVGKVVRKEHANGYTYVRQNGTADVLLDLDSLPNLPYQLIELDKYNIFDTSKVSGAQSGLKSATLNTARGCPYRCKFCSTPVIHEGRWRGYSPQRILEKVDTLYNKYGYRMIYFQDDYFPGNKKRFIEILKGLTKYNRELLWSTLGVRADILSQFTEEEVELLYKSGCHSIDIGIESGNERIITYINKGETLEQMRLTNQKLSKYNIQAKYTLIVGFPKETEEEILDTVRFASELEKTNPHAYCIIFAFLPIMGTPFYDEAVKLGLQTPKRLEDWAGMNYDDWMRKYPTWYSPELIRKLEAISFVSYFHNRLAEYKFGGSTLLRLSFKLYHPIARWRFNNQYFDFCFEIFLKNWLLKTKYALRKILRNFS